VTQRARTSGQAGRHSERLQQAETTHELVRITRSIPAAEMVQGYVVGAGARWTLLKVVVGGSTDGWVALRTESIAAIDPGDGARFLLRGLQHGGRWPPVPPPDDAIDLSSTRSLISSAAATFDLLSLHLEHRPSPGWLIGRPGSFSPGWVSWHQIDVDAAWQEEAIAVRFSSVTRLDFGGRYLHLLWRAADLRALLTGQDPWQHSSDRTRSVPLEDESSLSWA
jgi:hypothetical protein